ncbi:MAG: DUF2892 domain-containing protein [Promethearchaeota archaeon]
MVLVEISNRDRFTRAVFGIILIISFFFSWGIYAALILGILLIVSALTGLCITCYVYQRVFEKKCVDCQISSNKLQDNQPFGN